MSSGLEYKGMPRSAGGRGQVALHHRSHGQDTKYEVRSRTWVVPRGPYFFMIAMSGPLAGEDVSEAEFEQVLASIEIRR
jgi:hypothetical protein